MGLETRLLIGVLLADGCACCITTLICGFLCFLNIETVFNLTNNVDLENTKKKMEMYQKDNKDVIQKNKIKLVGLLPFFFFLISY